MNVHDLTRRKPDCSTRSHAVVVHDDTARGACAVTEPPFNTPAAAGALPQQRNDEALRPFQMAVSFPADPAAIPPMRRQLRALLCRSGLTEIADDAVLASQELMANAVNHGCRQLPPDTEITMTAAYNSARLRLAVHDPSGEKPRLLPASKEQEDGRGLQLVAAFADRWGVEANAEGAGKSVWMEFDSPSPLCGEGGS
ncbi:ATP-binding protein [Streptomyces chromofuscus]|uniref:ATP-binding protein n=1 Tax=Streptomyces chromofuscus TaxID=42881 RepID=A0A7M2T6G2_STRCW|nr:ATP-binding protein [Streptomyces chromofuscus]QOV43061.1 ATP-binding protein [Streptomyces chromofuscus]GGS93473.1 hypothetical protein GCM10010254_11840 [Streptomyces chromofuscus]